MYLSTFGGSGLLHLIAAHPRVIGVVGIAATVSMLSASLGPGRYVGTDDYLAHLERSISNNELVTAARRATAERNASEMLEQADDATIERAIAQVLLRCGSGCTDVSTALVAADPASLRRVLVLYELDRQVTHDASTPAAIPASRTPPAAGRSSE